MPPKARRILVVTPSFNSEHLIDETIHSVVSQAVDAEVEYHVQDGGSQDGTMAKLRRWEELLSGGVLPTFSRKLTFTYESAVDTGMYDAVNRGFAQLRPGPDDILTWINSDDRLVQGAAETVRQVFEDVPGCRFLSGRVSLLNEAGAILGVSALTGYARACLTAGLHDGRKLGFIMQEGTFFGGDVWLAVQGADPRFRLAGDWDLWRRMAAVAEHFSLDSITGFHRRRVGQLSGDMESYHREVDAKLAEAGGDQDAVLDRLVGVAASRNDLTANLVRFDASSGRWVSVSYNARSGAAPSYTTLAGEAQGYVVHLGTGASAPEGPYPEYLLPSGVRWLTAPEARGVVHTPDAGRYRLWLLARSGAPDTRFAISANDEVVLEAVIPDWDSARSEAFEVTVWLRAGLNAVGLSVQPVAGIERQFLVVELSVTVDRLAALPSPEWSVLLAERQPGYAAPAPLIAVVHVAGRATALDATIASIRAGARQPTRILVVRDDDPLTDAVLHALRDCIDLVLPAAVGRDPAALEAALRSVPADYVTTLEAGDLLAPGAIGAALGALTASGADAVRGLIELRDGTGQSRRKRLPRPDDRPAVRRRRPGAALAPVFVEIGRPLLARCLLGSTVSEEDRPRRPRVVVHESRCSSLDATTLLQNLAAVFALLGAEVIYSFDVGTEDGGTPAADWADLVIQAPDHAPQDHVTSTPVPAAPDGPTLARQEVLANGDRRLVLAGGLRDTAGPVALPDCVDTATLVPRFRIEARARMDLPPAAFVVALRPGPDRAVPERLLALLAEAAAQVLLTVLWLGEPPTADLDLVSVGIVEDDLLLSYAFSAADVLLVAAPADPAFILKAAACGLPVLRLSDPHVAPPSATDPAGLVGPAETIVSTLVRLAGDADAVRALAAEARCQVEAWNSLEAAILQLRAQAGSFPPRVTEWLLSCESVPVEPIRLPVRSSRPDTLGPPPSTPGVRLCAGVGAHPTDAALARTYNAPLGITIDGEVGTVFLELLEYAAVTLRLGLISEAPVNGKIRFDAGPWTPFAIEAPATTADVVIAQPAALGLHRLDFALYPTGQLVDGPRRLVIAHVEIQADPGAKPARLEAGRIRLESLSGRFVPELRRDGDWQFGESFYEMEAPWPGLGLFGSFRWSRGRRFTLHLLGEHAGWRRLRLALTGMLPGQCLRPVVDGVASAFCAPLDGLIGRVHYRNWLVRLPQGKAEIEFELSAMVQGADPRELGVIVLTLDLGTLAMHVDADDGKAVPAASTRPEATLASVHSQVVRQSPSSVDAFLSNVPGLIHVGANTGQERDVYAERNLWVLWIEALTHIHALLAANIAPFPQQSSVEALLTDAVGQRRIFHVASNNGASSSVFQFTLGRNIWPKVSFPQTIELTSTTLDTVVALAQIELSKFGALVLDTQGSELLVLKGAERVLERVQYVKTEAADFESYAGGTTVRELTSYLTNRGFVLAAQEPFAEHPSVGRYYELLFEKQTT